MSKPARHCRRSANDFRRDLERAFDDMQADAHDRVIELDYDDIIFADVLGEDDEDVYDDWWQDRDEDMSDSLVAVADDAQPGDHVRFNGSPQIYVRDDRGYFVDLLTGKAYWPSQIDGQPEVVWKGAR